MDKPMREDVRSLSELYPDPASRQELHYAFAHRFLPHYIHSNPYGFMYSLHVHFHDRPKLFLQSRWYQMEILTGDSEYPDIDNPDGPGVFKRVADLNAWKARIAGHPSAIVQMPPPERAPLAFFVGAVYLVRGDVDSWEKDAPSRIFTLERVESQQARTQGRALLCEWTTAHEHLNMGLGVLCTRDAFVAAIGTVLRSPEKARAVATFDAKTGQTRDLRRGDALQRKKPWWKFWSS